MSTDTWPSRLRANVRMPHLLAEVLPETSGTAAQSGYKPDLRDGPGFDVAFRSGDGAAAGENEPVPIRAEGDLNHPFGTLQFVQYREFVGVPYGDRRIFSAGGQQAAVRRPVHCIQLFGVGFGLVQRSSRFDFPEPEA